MYQGRTKMEYESKMVKKSEGLYERLGSLNKARGETSSEGSNENSGSRFVSPFYKRNVLDRQADISRALSEIRGE